MPAEVIPFPSARRRKTAETARYLSGLSEAQFNGHLRHQIQRLRERMERYGVASNRMQAELRSYEAAIGAELWRITRTPGGAA